MCDSCGCSDLDRTTSIEHSQGVRTVRVETDLLAKNDRIAAANREWFARCVASSTGTQRCTAPRNGRNTWRGS